MATSKRERQRANRAQKQEVEKVEEVADERRSRFTTYAILAGVIVLLALLWVSCTGGDDNSNTTETFASGEINEDTSVTETVENAVDPNLKPFGPLPDDFVPWSGTRQLTDVTPGLRNGLYGSDAPPMTIDTSLDYTATITTNRGVMTFDLFEADAPITVNNFVSLAEDGYFDGLSFHRVLADFMAQGGDPSGLGSGGPGYQFVDETDNGLGFTDVGQLAMANAGPDTNGSQFFITLAATPWLDGNHTIFGEITSGEDALGALRLRDPATDPALGDLITSIEITTG